LVCDIGLRKNPSDERGPKLISAIRQPHTMMTSGVRHVAIADLSPVAGIDIDTLRLEA
jgi:hypothetical protein